MVTSNQCLTKYGHPTDPAPWLTVWVVPDHLRQGRIPKRIYCNVDAVLPLRTALTNIINRGLVDQVRTWDGCFNIRPMRGGSNYSLHSWGIAVDINAATNRMGTEGDMSPELVQCWTDAGWKWGGEFLYRSDPMHFELKKI
jgi:hypothetical protein